MGGDRRFKNRNLVSLPGKTQARRGGFTKIWLPIILFLLGFSLLSWTPWPPEQAKLKQIQDDELAERYCPILVQGEKIKPEPSHIYYRMAEDESRILIAYHPVWAYEKDEQTKGISGLWNKLFYTGGLKLQSQIFGPGDIEALEVVVDKNTKKMIRLRYETASHQHQEKTEEELKKIDKLYLEVITWNHMLELISSEQAQGKQIYQLKPEYFSQQLWDYYKIVKKQKGLFSQDRAHFGWEVAEDKL